MASGERQVGHASPLAPGDYLEMVIGAMFSRTEDEPRRFAVCSWTTISHTPWMPTFFNPSQCVGT